ncbi:xin actin-binding repeat-containing protein 2 [Crotalus tigris]|uniref:xin actin-binding repeat-containing protein 2 n=1 Tax=Crotalus tigris TaxID=88082 RepID=UPI00192F476C|nr:xin actin-binding repeat-containing protein 2 [Crotalus tigris]
MALYQAAASKVEISNSSANALEESGACRIPGGLASVKNQFEKGEAQYQYQQKSVQKMTSQSQTMMSGRRTETSINEATSKGMQLEAFQSEKVTHQGQASMEAKKTSTINQNIDKTGVNASVKEDIPKISTQCLKQHFEKTTQGKTFHSGRENGTAPKQIKIENGYQEMVWPSANFHSSAEATSTSREQGTYMARKTEHTTAASTPAYNKFPKYGSTEEFPPPPSPDLLQVPSEMTEFSQSPDPPLSPSKQVLPKDLYSRQRNLYELNRLYKHIHPELRKNLEKDYFKEISDIVSGSNTEMDTSVVGDVLQAKQVFENRESSPQKSMSPEREYLEWDEILKGEVQSMKWIFENQPLDSIKDESPDQNNVKSIAGQEIIAGGDVKYTTWMFETQPIDALSANFSDDAGTADRIPDLARGDVRTATWMFETQPLDSMNKIHHEQEEEESNENLVNEITGGDVKTVKYMFETQNLDSLGQLYSVDEAKLLQLRSELKEIKGDVKRSIRHFETLPLYVIRNNLGQMLEIKTVHREDLEKGDVKTVRWMFETQPLDVINKEAVEIKVVHGISMEENIKGEVSRAKWLFETQPLDTIKESEESAGEKEIVLGTDVCRKCWLFETQPLDTLKENENTNVFPAVEIIGGDVNATKHLFETLPMDMLKDSPDVEKLQKMVATEEEKGDVKHQKWIFETKPLELIREERKEFIRTVKLEEIDKGDVSSCKQAFETCCLSKHNDSNKIQAEGVTRGAVKFNKDIFETTPLYAIQDNLGKYHKVKTIRQEEVIQGDVRNCRWLFETRPIDQFDESIEKIEIIKGITSKEVQSGDVKTAKWLFETQPLDSIKYFSNVEEEESKPQTEATEVVKGDVRMCKWLFETQPMESLYEKETTVTNTDEMQRGDVKTCTLLFETQSLDAIGVESETANKLHTVEQEDIQGSDVRTACFLFETEKLENIQGEEDKELKQIVEIDIQPGDVSTMKYKFETQPLDSLSINSEEVLNKIKTIQSEDIQKGNVLHCCWLFENRSLGEISEDKEERTSAQTITDVQDGHVKNGCFIFETFSLDQIKDEESVDESIKKTINQEEITKGDVKSYKMLFETQPLYAIQDTEGYYHEVTTVRKEEVIHGDVRGTRWLFETKPLGSINKSENVYVIKSVTQEDIQKGNVSSVRYRFETQSLDMISDEEKFIVPTVNSVQGGNVKANKKLFESEETQGDKYVRTVNVSEIQQGNVKTCTWLFETHTIDEIRGEDSEYKDIQTVTREEVQEGDVQHAVWLFENQPLDSIKENEETDTKIDKEEIPQADVKTTTWLFETTPFHEFNESRIEKEEIVGKSVKETLKELYSQKVVETHGIILEADEIGDVRMAKYKLMNQEAPEIQKEEIIKGDLASIMINLLSKQSSLERETKVNEDEKGNVNLTKKQLMNSSTAVRVEKEEVVRGDIQQAIKKLFNKDRSVKRGILIQESERGDINMTIYSLFHKKESNKVEQGEVMGGDVKRTIHSLLSSVMNHEISERPKIDDSERGNVQFFTTCIEAGALDCLKLLQSETNETFASKNQDEEEEIMGGDVEGTKLLLKKKKSQIQRTVNEADIIPGDVCNALKIFTTEAQNTSCHVDQEEIIKGDLKTTLNSLSQAINQTAVAEKEEIAKADIHAILKSLQESVYQPRETEKPEVIIPGDIKQTIESLEKAIETKNEVLREEVVQNDLETTLRSLKAVQQSSKETDKEVVRGNTQTAIESLLDTSEKTKSRQCQRFTEAEAKQSNEMLMKPSQQLVQNKVNPTERLKSNNTFLQKEAMSQKKSFLIEDAKAIHLDQRWNTKSHEMEKKNMKALSKSQHKVTEKADTSVDKVTAKRHRDQYVIDQSTFCNNAEKNERSEKSEASRILMKGHSTNDMQAAKQMTGKKQNIFHEYKDEKYVDVRSQGETKAKSVQPTWDHQSFNYRGTPEQLINQSTGLISKAAGHLETKEVQQDRKQSQHSKEVCRGKKNNVMASQAQVSMASEQNVKTNQKVRVTQEIHKQFKEAERKQKWSEKSILKYSGKSKVEGADEDLRVQVKNPGNPYRNPKGSDRSEIDSPPPPPPPPPPTLPLTSSEVDFPLPPPPPHLLMPCNRQRFPSPPSPSNEGVKTEHESFPPPPPTTEEKYDDELTSHLPPPPLPQPKDHFFKSLDKSVQSQDKIPYNTKHLQTEVIKELEARQCKASRKMQPRIIQMPKEVDKANTMEERTECSVTETIGLEVSPSNKTFPHFRSPSLPAEATQASPKPNVRKFKTPLMIAEEKYKLQKEQMEQKQAKDVCQLHVRRNSETWGRLAQAESEGGLPVPKSYKQDEITRSLPSEVPATPTEPECQRKPQVTNSEADDLQPLAKQSMAEQSQNVSKCSAEEHLRKKAVHESQHLIKQSVSSEKAQTHQEHVISKKEQHQKEQLHVSSNKAVCPSFKVRTIQDPACDHTLPKDQRDSTIYKKQEGSSVHGVLKQPVQEKQKEKISKKSAAGNCMKMDGKTHMEKTLYKYTEGRQEIGDKESSGMKQRLIQRKETEKDNMKQEKHSLAMEGKESQVIANLKEEKGIIQRKEQSASSKSEKMVKQKIINIHNKFQTVHSKPEPTFVLETNVQNKNLSQEKNNLQGQGEYILEITPEQKKSPHKTPEPKKQLVQEKMLPSSLSRGSLQKSEKNSVDILELLRKREEIQQLLSRLKEFEMEPSKNGMKTFQVFLSVIPEWLVEQEKKQDLSYIAQEDSVEKMREELLVIKDQASKILHSCEDAIQAAMISTNSLKCKKNVHSTGGSKQKIAKVTIGSSRKDSQKTKEMSKDTMVHEKVKEKVNENRFSEIRTSSPSLRTRAPSPTYITIESRCIESPFRDLLSPVQRESPPVPPSPPPRSTTPTSKIQQSSARSEQLAKLKDTTVKLSQGAIPNRSVTPIPFVEKRSEIVKSPATLRRQIKIDTRQPDVCKVPFANDTHVTAEAVKKVHEMHEESQVNQMYISQKGGSIPEEPHGQSVGSISIAHCFEVPKAGPKGLRHRYEASDQVIHIRKEPDLPETFGSEYKTDTMSQTFNDQTLSEGKSKNKYIENGTMSDKSKEVRCRSRKGRLSQTSQEQVNTINNFQKSPGKHQRESKETDSKKQNQRAIKEHSCEPRACFDVKSPMECSYGMESFENMVTESRTATSTAQSTDGTKSGFGFKRAPPTYEDVISGHILDISAPDSPEDLLRNFQKTWQESERVFQSLGYTMSEATEAEVRSSFHEEAEFISETATSGKGNMPTLSKESLSNGVPSGRQADFP